MKSSEGSGGSSLLRVLRETRFRRGLMLPVLLLCRRRSAVEAALVAGPGPVRSVRVLDTLTAETKDAVVEFETVR